MVEKGKNILQHIMSLHLKGLSAFSVHENHNEKHEASSWCSVFSMCQRSEMSTVRNTHRHDCKALSLRGLFDPFLPFYTA